MRRTRWAVLGGLALVAAAIACTSAPQPSPTPMPSPTPLPFDWGPLAVYRADGLMEALATGTLVITDTCTFLESHGDKYLLAWREMPELWHWDPATREIVSTWGSRTIHFASGDGIALGGGGFSLAEGSSIEDMIAQTDWLSPPRPGCVTPQIWFASGQMSTR